MFKPIELSADQNASKNSNHRVKHRWSIKELTLKVFLTQSASISRPPRHFLNTPMALVAQFPRHYISDQLTEIPLLTCILHIFTRKIIDDGVHRLANLLESTTGDQSRVLSTGTIELSISRKGSDKKKKYSGNNPHVEGWRWSLYNSEHRNDSE